MNLLRTELQFQWKITHYAYILATYIPGYFMPYLINSCYILAYSDEYSKIRWNNAENKLILGYS